MDTPYTDHLTADDYEQVYEPAEDTFLLLDAIEADLPYIEEMKPLICMEIGPGSGVIVTALAKKLAATICLASDINAHACRTTLRTAERNNTRVDTINCNLVDGVRKKSIDLLIFNPPYVVTTDDELETRKFGDSHLHSNLVYSWAGGTHGRRVIDELILRLDEILSTKGVLYLLVLRENRPDEIICNLDSMGFTAIKFFERRIPGEYLFILKVARKPALC